MSNSILNVTKKEYEAMKAQGVDDESLLKPGKYKLQRRAKATSEKAVAASNINVEVTLQLGLDIIKRLQAVTGNDDPKALKKTIEKILRKFLDQEFDKSTVERSILSDKKFIAALVREVKKAA